MEHPLEEHDEHGEHHQDPRSDRQREVAEELLDELRLPDLDQPYPVGQLCDLWQGVDLGERRTDLDAVEVRLDDDASALVITADGRGAAAEGDLCHRFERHRPARRGAHGKVLEGRKVAARTLEQTDADRHLPLGQRELRGVLRQIAQRRDADGLTDRGDRHPEFSRLVEPRSHQELRTLKVTVDARVAQFRQRAHRLDRRTPRRLEFRRILTGQVERDGPTATAGFVVLEGDPRIGHRGELGP